MLAVKGNGNIVSREIVVSTFIRLHLSGKGIIELHQSDEEKVIVETDENLQEYFEVQNSGRTLYVASDAKFRRPEYTSCRIRVFLRQIDTLLIRNDGADVICPEEISLAYPIEVKVQSVGNTELHLVAPAIRVLCQSEGNTTLKGTCGALYIKNQSEGDFNATAMLADEVYLKNMAEGNVGLYARKVVEIHHFGKGYVHYAGDAVVREVRQYGDGEIRHVNPAFPIS